MWFPLLDFEHWPFDHVVSSLCHNHFLCLTVWGQNRKYPFADGGGSWEMGPLSLPCMPVSKLSQMKMVSMCYCCVIFSWYIFAQRYFSYYIMCLKKQPPLSPVLLLAFVLHRHRIFSNYLSIHLLTKYLSS